MQSPSLDTLCMTSNPSDSTTYFVEHICEQHQIPDTLQSVFCNPAFLSDHPQLGPKPTRKRRKRRKVVAYRTSSLDRGRDTYYKEWTATDARSFKPEPNFLTETDSERITTLWEKVSMAGIERTLRLQTVSQSGSTTSSKKPKRPSPYDKGFYFRILVPRSIAIESGISVKAYIHFGVKEPTGNRFQYYTKERGAKGSTLWLEDDEDLINRIVAEYVCMVQSGFCEAEFAFYAVGTILKAEPRNVNPALMRCWRAERTVQLVAKPILKQSSSWVPPPVISNDNPDHSTEYEFDLRPDCAFWLSLQAFNQDYVTQLQPMVFVVKKRMTCPYLTIEFKKDDALEQAALNKLAGAAALVLYNRFILRKKTIGVLGSSWTEPLVKTLRHYGITWTGSEFDIWCVVPVLTPEFEWAGCKMTEVYHGDCMNTSSVRELINWLNEIHCWGLTVHGPRCEKDIMIRVNAQESGLRSTDIGADSEDESNGPD